jgi:hypothetical protein
MNDALRVADSLNLEPHPEGGWFRRTWTAPARVDTSNGERATASAILFLLDRGMEAAWHVVVSDELWLWHGPGTLEIHDGGDGPKPVADPNPRLIDGSAVQHLVPAGRWQRTIARDSHCLATCVVSPEFTYDDWRLA